VFTGIIEDVGKVVSAGGGKLVVETELGPIEVGESVSVSGVCLTVRSTTCRGSHTLMGFDVAPETSAATTVGKLHTGSPVNIERALRADGRLGGHMMTGHIEGTGRLWKRERAGNSEIFTFTSGPELERYIVPKGSIGVDGISLTVVESRRGFFSVSVVPHTLGHTNLGTMVAAQSVNLEPDVLAKYVENMLASAGRGGKITEEMLRRNGFMS
jgi:riboflavin synthase